MSDATPPPVLVGLAIADPVLAERLAAALASAPGLRLAGPDEPADVTMVMSAARAHGPDLEAPLTPRERDVLTLLAEGASNKSIARHLGISVHTAKFHIGRLIDKLDATGRTDVVTHAARLGVLHL